MADKKYNFIVIDDSKLECFIAEKIIQNTGQSESIKSFLQAKDALVYLKTHSFDQDIPVVIFVDLQIPVMNGFEFLAEFEKIPVENRKNFTLYLMNSSITEDDLNRARNFPSLKQFLHKPLTSRNLQVLLS